MRKNGNSLPRPLVWIASAIVFALAVWLVWALAYGAGFFVGSN